MNKKQTNGFRNGIANGKNGIPLANGDKSLEYLKAADEAKDNTRIVRYIFILVAAFLLALFSTHFLDLGDESEPLLSSELIHFIAGSLFTSIGVIIDRYFKSGTQKDAEKDLTYLVGKLKQQEQVEDVKTVDQEAK